MPLTMCLLSCPAGMTMLGGSPPEHPWRSGPLTAAARPLRFARSGALGAAGFATGAGSTTGAPAGNSA